MRVLFSLSLSKFTVYSNLSLSTKNIWFVIYQDDSQHSKNELRNRLYTYYMPCYMAYMTEISEIVLQGLQISLHTLFKIWHLFNNINFLLKTILSLMAWSHWHVLGRSGVIAQLGADSGYTDVHLIWFQCKGSTHSPLN